ncbi:TonB C-terminal domain-containing protein [Herbaspirillum autotrophicum]|uniref:TonB C-terminal domain-containing protein n=1 Tax=Herbaspirillum autotrophicum TaxID=180195 RepID=UPI0009F94B54|nr:TonB C-terminal domain-containing protein [Herbaspirillum autotrophicum]
MNTTLRAPVVSNALLLSMCFAVSLLALGVACAADAERAPAGVMRFDLPAQALETALQAFGGVSGYSVLVAAQLTAGRRAAEVRGEFLPQQALQLLLAGTGLRERYIGTEAHAFTLEPVPSDATAARGAAAPLPAAVPVDPGWRRNAYAQVLQASITRALCRAQPDSFGRYRMGVQLWLERSGAVRDVHLLESSGMAAQDQTVLQQLARLVMDAPPPPDMAQPLTILLTPRPDPAADCRRVARQD